MTPSAVANGHPAMSTPLQEVADAVVRRAQRNGFVVPSDVRAELKRAGEPTTLWKDVLALARPALVYRRPRYYYAPPVGERARQELSQQEMVVRAARQLIAQCKAAASQVERRVQDRFDFIHPVRVRTEDGREFTLLSRDISTSGMRLLATRSLLGQKVRVYVPRGEGSEAWSFVLRILWTCGVADGMFENGGTFVEAAPEAE